MVARGTGESAEQPGHVAERLASHDPIPPPAPLAMLLERSSISTRIARRTVGQWLLASSCPADFVEDAVLIVDELVSNVIVHAASPARVVTSVDDGRLRLEVHDHSSSPPVVPDEATRTSGLQLVAMLADDWGWSGSPDGKYVWIELRFADPADQIILGEPPTAL